MKTLLLIVPKACQMLRNQNANLCH